MILNSWKEIAVYLGRGVRTVQRYERDLALPVRRPRGRSRSAVVALSQDLDAWLRDAPRNNDTEENNKSLALQRSRAPQLVSGVRESIGQGQDLRYQCRELLVAHNQAVINLISSLSRLVREARNTMATVETGSSLSSSQSSHFVAGKSS